MANGPGSCFVIGPMGPARSPIRKRADVVLDEVVRPVAEDFGYQVERGGEDPGGDFDILANVLRRVMEDELVVADLTGGNPNVFYELAIRHAAAKPLIQIADEGERGRLPFDVDKLTVTFIDHRTPEDLEAAREALTREFAAVRDGKVRTRAPLSALADALSGIAKLLWPRDTLSAAQLEMMLKSVKTIQQLTSEAEPKRHLKALRSSMESLLRQLREPSRILRPRGKRRP